MEAKFELLVDLGDPLLEGERFGGEPGDDLRGDALGGEIQLCPIAAATAFSASLAAPLTPRFLRYASTRLRPALRTARGVW